MLELSAFLYHALLVWLGFIKQCNPLFAYMATHDKIEKKRVESDKTSPTALVDSLQYGQSWIRVYQQSVACNCNYPLHSGHANIVNKMIKTNFSIANANRKVEEIESSTKFYA